MVTKDLGDLNAEVTFSILHWGLSTHDLISEVTLLLR